MDQHDCDDVLKKLDEFDRIHSKNSKIIDYQKVFGMCLMEFKDKIRKALNSYNFALREVRGCDLTSHRTEMRMNYGVEVSSRMNIQTRYEDLLTELTDFYVGIDRGHEENIKIVQGMLKKHGVI